MGDLDFLDGCARGCHGWSFLGKLVQWWVRDKVL
jgi:hypothetical protein